MVENLCLAASRFRIAWSDGGLLRPEAALSSAQDAEADSAAADYSSLTARELITKDLEELKVTLAQRNTRAANAAHRSRRSERAEKAAAARDSGAGGANRCLTASCTHFSKVCMRLSLALPVWTVYGFLLLPPSNAVKLQIPSNCFYLKLQNETM